MKNISILFICFFILIYQNLYGQVGPTIPCPDLTPTGDEINLTNGAIASQSSNITLGGGPELAIDGDLGSSLSKSSRTSMENNPFWEVDLGRKSIIKKLQVWYDTNLFPNGLQGSYVFFSEIPFGSKELTEVLTSAEVTHIYIATNLSSGFELPIEPQRARYVRIQYNRFTSIGFYEAIIRGIPGDPLTEICDNGIDDDGDCKIDCADSDCKPSIWTVTMKDPTCKNCTDGEIYVKANGNNLEFSLDNGLTYINCSPTGTNGYCTFTGLAEGEYQVKVKSGLCETVWRTNPIVLRAPIGKTYVEHCNNGSFETGDEYSWTGTIGVNSGGFNYFINQTGITDFNASPQHQIHSNNNWTDKLLKIPINAPSGEFYVQVGDDLKGSNAASIRYCLKVDQTNVMNNFWYFLVMRDGTGDHDLNKNPYFQYRILDINDNVLFSFPPIIADQSNPFFNAVPNSNLVFKNWTCQQLDLSQWFGQQICIEFIASDCSEGGHLGYAYIDGFCSDLDPPSATFITPPHVFCTNQSVNIAVTDEKLLNEYQWYFARIDNSGNVFDPVTLPKMVGFKVPALNDLLSIYKLNYPSYSVNCTDRFKIILRMYNNCSYAENSQIISFSCNAYDLSYPDIIVCSNNQDVEVIGTNSCNGCTVEWSISNDPHNLSNPASKYLSDIHSPKPKILGTLNSFAFDMTYKITVTTPEGCIYMDDVATINLENLNGTIGSNANGVCTFDNVSFLSYPFPINFSKYFDINYFIQSNYGQLPNSTDFEDIPNEQLPITLITQFNTLADKYYFKPNLKSLLRGFKQKIQVSLTFKPNTNVFRIINPNCPLKQWSLTRDKDSPFFGDIDIFVPNGFAPSSPEQEQAIIHPFPNYLQHNIYEVWFSIYDRWGSLVHEGHIKSQNNQPLLEPEMHGIGWDGKFNGQEMDPAVFVYKLDFQNCQIAPAGCFEGEDNGIDESGIIAPEPNIIKLNNNFPFAALANGTKVAVVNSFITTTIKCDYSTSPNNLIINYNYCSGKLKCDDGAHTGEIELVK